MDDRDVLKQIHDLVAEEKHLRSRHVGDGLTAVERQRLQEVEEGLDQCWDLLRQRRAKEEVGADPDEVKPRPPDEVESYLQ
jgi:hypothetical protein